MRSKMKMFVSPIAALAMIVSGLAVATAVPANAAGATLTVHYHRTDGDYTGWDMWHWGDVTTSDQANFSGEDAFGKIATFEIKAPSASVGIIFRKGGWDVRDGAVGAGGDGNGDRSITLNPTGDTEVWFIQGDKTAYTSEPRTVRIHYKRTNADYTGWNIWNWGDVLNATSDESGGVLADGTDEYGAVFNFRVKSDGTGIGFLFRDTQDWGTAQKDLAPGAGGGGGDRAANLAAGKVVTEIWMMQGDATAYSENPALIVKTDQTIRPFVKKSVKVLKKVTFPMLTTDGTKVKWKSLNPAICVVAGRNYVIGVRPGVCNLEASAPGSRSLNALVSFKKSITVKA